MVTKMSQQETQSSLPENIQEKYQMIAHMDIGAIARLINIRAGRVPSSEPQAKTIIQQFNLIESELLEGKRATADGDLTQVRDAIADIILLAAGQMGHIVGIDVNEDYKRMCAYNMSRIPTNAQDAVNTVKKYEQLGIEAVILDEFTIGDETLYPVITVDREQYSTSGEHFPPKKFLKSVSFHDAEYEPIPFVTIKGTGSEVAHLIGTQFTENHFELIKAELERENLAGETILETIKNLIGVRA